MSARTCESVWMRVLFGSVLAVAALSARPSSAQDEPRVEDTEAVFRAFEVFVEHQRISRIGGALGGAVMGGVAMGVGTLVASETDTATAPWLIAGGVTLGLSVLALVIPGEVERVAHEASVSGTGHTAAQARALELRWQELAAAAKTERYVGAAVGFVLGAGSLGSGVAIMAGAGDFSGDDEAVIGGLLIGGGAAILVGSAVSLFVETPAERAFDQYSAGASLELSAGLGPTGFSLGARGAF
jgi:hypothetical protein